MEDLMAVEPTIKSVIYGLSVFTSVACTVLLLRSYARTGARLLLWTALCFVGLSLNNIILFFDVRVIPYTDLSPWRTLAAFAGVSVLLYGFIWETE